MGKKLNLYYEQLKNLMSGQPPKTLDEAVEALKAQRPAAAPEGEDERKRFDYAMKCDDQIMGHAAEKLKKEAAWDAAAKNVRKRSEKPDLQVSRGAGDWLVSMMKTGDDWQDKVYNEVLVAQVAFCTGQIGFKNVGQTYQGIRLYYDSAATYESIQNDYLASIYNAPRQILEELDKKVEQGQRELAQLDGSADAILSGEAGDHVVESAYRTLESDAIDLLLNAKGALEDIKGFEKTLPEKYQNKIPAAELEQRQNELQVPDKERVDSARERAEQAGDQFYADLNQEAPAEENEERYSIDADLPFAMEDEEAVSRENSINSNSSNQERQSGDDELPYFMEEGERSFSVEDDVIEEQPEPKVPEQKEQAKAPVRLTLAQKTVLKNQRLNEFLEPYGLTWEDKDRKNTGADRIVYRNEKTGRTAILNVTEVDAADGYKVEISDAAPGHIVNFDLAQRIGDVKGKVKLLETREDHTVEYNKVVETWAALMEAELDNEPSLNQVKDVGNRFHLFGQALEKYIKMRGNKPEPDQKQSWYMQTIKELRSLVSDKLDAIELVDNHIRTKNELELDGKELEAAIGAAQAKPKRKARSLGLPDTYIETAMKWSEKISGMIEQHDEQTEKAWDAAIKRARDAGLKNVTPPEPIPLSLFPVLEQANNMNSMADKNQLKILLGAPYYDPLSEDGAARAQENGRPKRTLYDAALEGKLGPRELADTLAKSALACEVAKELVKLESKMVEKVDPPIQSLINSGRLYDVVDMVKNSQSFGEHYRFLDLSTKPEGKKKDIMEGKVEDVPKPEQVAKEIMKSYLDRQRQAQAQNAQQPKHAPVDMQIKGPKQPVLK